MIHQSTSVSQTETIAAALARTFVGGEILALYGELGAGKTQFVRGLLIGLGGNPRTVSSPTFVLQNIYDTGRIPLHHFDAYRITSPEDFQAIGFTELLDQKIVIAIEWPARIEKLLPPKTLHIQITPTSATTRQIQIPL